MRMIEIRSGTILKKKRKNDCENYRMINKYVKIMDEKEQLRLRILRVRIGALSLGSLINSSLPGFFFCSATKLLLRAFWATILIHIVLFLR